MITPKNAAVKKLSQALALGAKNQTATNHARQCGASGGRIVWGEYVSIVTGSGALTAWAA
jgi:hypothetical protein